jgi:heptosyltransferase-1
MGTPRRILIIKLGSIGDVVHTLPALADLKRAFPDSEIDWLVESKPRAILDGNRRLHEVIEVDTQRWRRKPDLDSIRELWKVISKLRARSYDLAFDFQGLWKSAAFGYLSGARQLIGFDRHALKESGSHFFYDTRIAPCPQAVHVIDLYKELLRGVQVEPGPYQFDLAAAAGDESYVEEQLASRRIEDFLILNPGGGWETKNWAPDNYARLHSRLSTETGLKSVLTWGPGEELLVSQVCRACSGSQPITFPTTLTQFIALVKRARLFIGGDTGPLHIAAACRTPIVGIFGPTDPRRNGPFSPSDIVVSRRVPCGPCYKRACEIYQKECMQLVQVEEVYQAAIQRLKMKSLQPVT